MAEVNDFNGHHPEHAAHMGEVIDFIRERFPAFETLMIVEHAHNEKDECVTYTSHFTTSEENVNLALDDLDHFVEQTRTRWTGSQN